MTQIYVAASKNLSEWAEGVGLTRNVYKLGLAEETAEEAVETLNQESFAGQTDWQLLANDDALGAEEGALIERLARREKLVDPKFYPRIKGARGIFKAKIEVIENHVLVQRALDGKENLAVKLKPKDVANYLIKNALG